MMCVALSFAHVSFSSIFDISLLFEIGEHTAAIESILLQKPHREDCLELKLVHSSSLSEAKMEDRYHEVNYGEK